VRVPIPRGPPPPPNTDSRAERQTSAAPTHRLQYRVGEYRPETHRGRVRNSVAQENPCSLLRRPLALVLRTADRRVCRRVCLVVMPRWCGSGLLAGRRTLALTRYCFTSKLYCGSQSSFHCPPLPPTPLPYCNTIARLLNYRRSPTIHYW